jgi:hypothetical protein
VTSVRRVFVEAAVGGLELVGSPRVAQDWDRPSVLDGMTVGALAAHLARQVTRVPEVLSAPVPDERPVSLVEHYLRSAWTTAGPDDEANVGIRTRAAADAAPGPAEVLARALEALATARSSLPDEPAARWVRPPWLTWNLTLDDYLRSRMLEIVVHADDLTLSVGLEPVEWPEEVVAPVLGVLTTVAVRRHGVPAVLRTLARAERAPRSIAAF